MVGRAVARQGVERAPLVRAERTRPRPVEQRADHRAQVLVHEAGDVDVAVGREQGAERGRAGQRVPRGPRLESRITSARDGAGHAYPSANA